MKQFFNTRKEAVTALATARVADGVYRMKHGRHKGQYFVGTYMEFINKY